MEKRQKYTPIQWNVLPLLLIKINCKYEEKSDKIVSLKSLKMIGNTDDTKYLNSRLI